MGRILGEFGDRMLEALQGFGDGVGHGDVDVVFWVVTINGQSAVLSDILVDGDGLMLLECIHEVGGVGGSEEFDAKFVYSKGEKVVVRVEWVQRPGLFSTGVYPWVWRFLIRRL